MWLPHCLSQVALGLNNGSMASAQWPAEAGRRGFCPTGLVQWTPSRSLLFLQPCIQVLVITSLVLTFPVSSLPRCPTPPYYNVLPCPSTFHSPSLPPPLLSFFPLSSPVLTALSSQGPITSVYRRQASIYFPTAPSDDFTAGHLRPKQLLL